MPHAKLPNVLIAGTPGTGKSTVASDVCVRLGMEHVDVSEFAKRHGMVTSYDSLRDTHVIDEDRVIEALEDKLTRGGALVDYHSADMFPSRWFHLVVVTRTDNTILYDRLKARNYSDEKVTENVQCEIFEMILEEARGLFDADVVKDVVNNTESDKEDIVDTICNFVQRWKPND